MDDSIDTKLFIEIILSEGARELYSNSSNGVNNKYFSGRNNNGRVLICVEDEFLPKSTVKGLLIQLDMVDLIQPLLN